ncbi:MAG TPA: class I SAM-dependent methyltransferase, partial [Abditibacterium sp.]
MSPSSVSSPRASPALFLAVALIAGAVLGFEVALTRVFAVLLRYQFAFLVISLALCGLGLGGLWAHKKRDLDLSNTAVAFGIAVSLSLLLILRGVFAVRPDQFWIAALLVLLPFVIAGAWLASVFSRHSNQGGALYGIDLAGASLAALGSVLLMQWLGAIQTCLLFAALGALAGVFTAKKPAFALIMSAILLGLVPYNARIGLWRVPDVPPRYEIDPITKIRSSLADRGVTQPLFTELGDKTYGSKIVDTRWNAFARTDVVADPQAGEALLLYTNGNVPTNMMRWDGKLWTIPRLANDFPLSDWTFEGANLPGQKVLSIGPGGGLDALLALRYGAGRFDGAEINPSIVALMKEPKYAKFNGGIYNNPRVNVVTAEGRAFVRESAARGERYRLIFSALTKTATAGQGTALLESFIYTSDAFDDYLNALDDEGQVAIVGDAPQILARLFATATAHFKAQGLSERE